MSTEGDAADPFGLTSFGIADLVARPGVKWSHPAGRLASWVADMDFPIAPAVTARLTQRVGVDVGYPAWDEAARSPLPALFAERMAARYGWRPDVDRLHELTEVLQGIALAVHHLTEPGDGVVVHTPAYPPFLQLIAATGRRLIEVPARGAADRFQWDYEDLAARLAAGAGSPGAARLWILCHPHNPTGRVFGPEELGGVAELAARHDLVVLSDEIHADLVHRGATHVPFAALGPDIAARTVTLSSSSKAFNLAGLRWAILHAGHDGLHGALRALPPHLLGVPNLLAVEATEAAWTEGDGWLAAVLGVLDENRHRLADLLAERLPAVRYHVPEATYLAWLDCRELGFGDDPAVEFRKRGVELSPGPTFGSGGRGFARLNFATSPAVLDEIVARLGGEGQGR
jgi:cystathionine beta-lyase